MRALNLPIILLLLLIACLAGHWALDALLGERLSLLRPAPEGPASAVLTAPGKERSALRLVSLAPSITETLFAVGLGSQVAGVTHFCTWPPEAAALPKVAGFSELNPEAILRAQPDLAILPADKDWNRTQLTRLGIPTLSVEVRSLEGLLTGIRQLAALAPDPRPGQRLLTEIEQALEAARLACSGKSRPGVLFSVMQAWQHPGSGQAAISEISAIGRDGFYDQLIQIAGGRNVYAGALPYPRLSREAIIHLNPELIIDVLPSAQAAAAAEVRQAWQRLDMLDAVKNGRIIVLADEMHTVPGPRFIQTLNILSQALHPADKGGAGGAAAPAAAPNPETTLPQPETERNF